MDTSLLEIATNGGSLAAMATMLWWFLRRLVESVDSMRDGIASSVEKQAALHAEALKTVTDSADAREQKLLDRLDEAHKAALSRPLNCPIQRAE